MAMRLVVHIHALPVWTIPPAQVARIRAALPDVEVVDVRSDAECERAVTDAEVMFATRIPPQTLAAAPRLRWVHSSAVGVGGLPLPALAARGVVVTNARGIHAATIAEHTIALLLALRRHLPAALVRQMAGQWSQRELSTLVVPVAACTRVLVVGLGSIGARVAAQASALGMSVIGIRRHADRPAPPGVERVYAPDDLHALLPTMDVVVLAAPRTDETGALIGAAEFALMKPTALLINIARGGLIDEPALIDALTSGRLGGAGLDVVSREPLDPTSPLWTLPNVIITPHTAAFAGDYWTPVVDAFLDNFHRFRAGAALDNLVDPALGY